MYPTEYDEDCQGDVTFHSVMQGEFNWHQAEAVCAGQRYVLPRQNSVCFRSKMRSLPGNGPQSVWGTPNIKSDGGLEYPYWHLTADKNTLTLSTALPTATIATNVICQAGESDGVA